MRRIRIGYVPLTDAAVLIAAAELGFAQRHGLVLDLARESSWATLRDKLVLGLVDGAHLLAPLALATSVGLGPGPGLPLVVPFVLSLNGNAIAVSMALWREMGCDNAGPADVRAALARVGRERAVAGKPLRFATVFPYSTHTLLLHQLLAGSGLRPDRDIGLTVVPPPYAASALMTGAIDGVCVGAPWASVAVEAGAACIVALGAQLMPDAIEKVLALPRDRHSDDVVRALVAALKEAAIWCAAPGHWPELARLLGETRHLGLESELVLRALEGRLLLERDGPFADEPAYLRVEGPFNRPDPASADWVLDRMEALGQIRADAALRCEARSIFDPSSFDCI